MNTIAEIEAAIENLPSPQVDQLAHWLETLRQRHATPPPVESWLQRARGAAIPGVKTTDVDAPAWLAEGAVLPAGRIVDEAPQ